MKAAEVEARFGVEAKGCRKECSVSHAGVGSHRTVRRPGSTWKTESAGALTFVHIWWDTREMALGRKTSES